MIDHLVRSYAARRSGGARTLLLIAVWGGKEITMPTRADDELEIMRLRRRQGVGGSCARLVLEQILLV